MTKENTSSKACEAASCMKKFAWVLKIAEWKLAAMEKLVPFFNIVPRLVVAKVFWDSGVLKLPQGFLGVGRGNWDSTLLLFEYEHPVPGLSPELAAYSGTTFEILCPILLVLGLGSRPAAAVLLMMTAVIEFTYQHSMDHVYWAVLLGLIIIQGPGRLSLDYLIRKKTKACLVYSEMVGCKAD